jgi:phage shock protein C
MRKVITVGLNNHAFQIAEDGYEALRVYLDAAETRLASNPDRAEVLADLEQSIGDKCNAYIGPHKTVVTGEEIRQILREMGPVTSANGEADAAGTVPGGTADERWGSAAPAFSPRRRLFRIPSQGMLGGVCAGLAAYFGLDVVWIRIAFVLLTLTTGVWLLVWLTMLFVMPRAATPTEIAAAHGEGSSTREILDGSSKMKPSGTG